MKKAIILFSRIPEAGKTKTRLMPYLSGDQCALLHEAFLRDVTQTIVCVDADLVVAYTPESDEELSRWFGNGVSKYILQIGNDLGERMRHAFEEVFSMGYERAVLIGADIPQISKKILENAFVSLDESDVVLNPTKDGGYYLIGMKKPQPDIWKVTHYGTNTVWEDTVAHIEQANLQIHVGEILYDIDEPEDLIRLEQDMIDNKFQESELTYTKRYLSEQKLLDENKCTHCGACTDACVFLQKYGLDLGDFAERPELAYSCFLCGKCKEVCPVEFDGAKISLSMRRESVQKNHGSLESKAYDGLLWEKNPYKFANYKKADCKSVVFPGCNFPSFYPKTMKVLEDAMAKHGIGVAYDCCGKPVSELGLVEDARKSLEIVENKLKKQGVEELIMVCPNCYYYMKDKIRIPMVTIYEKLEELGLGGKVSGEEIPVYYPCPDREKGIFIEGIRKYLDGSLTEIYQDVQCCGLGGCAAAVEKDLASDMIERAREKEQPLYTYCASCVSNYKRSGMKEVYHFLPMILGVEEELPGGIKPFLNRAVKKIR